MSEEEREIFPRLQVYLTLENTLPSSRIKAVYNRLRRNNNEIFPVPRGRNLSQPLFALDMDSPPIYDKDYIYFPVIKSREATLEEFEREYDSWLSLRREISRFDLSFTKDFGEDPGFSIL